MMKDYGKILNDIIEAYYSNEYPEYFQDDVYEIFKKEGITEEYRAEPIKHGQWIEDEYGIPHCSECGTINNTVYKNYCPNCGVKMDEVEE